MKSFKDVLYPNMTESEYLNLPHDEKYQTIIKALDYESVKKCIPFSLEELKTAYETNKSFNNLDMRKWDYAAGYTGGPSRCDFVGNTITGLYHNIGVDCFSCSEGICILKQCAKMWIAETEV